MTSASADSTKVHPRHSCPAASRVSFLEDITESDVTDNKCVSWASSSYHNNTQPEVRIESLVCLDQALLEWIDR